MSRMRKFAAIAAVLAVPVLGVTALASPALATPTGYFILVSRAAVSSCTQEVDTSGVEIAGCGSTYTSNELWVAGEGDGNEIANEATNWCLSVSGEDAGVYLHACDPGATAQEWIPESGTSGILLENNHTHYCLWQSNSSLQQRADCDTTNVHDQWSEDPE